MVRHLRQTWLVYSRLYIHAKRTGNHAKEIVLRVWVIGIAVVRYPRETEFLIKSLADLFMDTPLFNAHTTVHSLTCAADLPAAAVPAPHRSRLEYTGCGKQSAANVPRRLRCKGRRPPVTAGRACVPCSGSTVAR